ncbi:MAG: VWA domain-containing protein [Acidobacteria bacterium]|nr:VWA domain-containing protein [Acidobacteriota bacterium]
MMESIDTTLRALLRNLAMVFAAYLAFTASLAAQQEQTGQIEPPPLIETVDVQIINIDAVVTDRRGNPITGLTIDDFELYENGKLQKITNFYEVNETSIRRVERAAGQDTPVESIEETKPSERPPQLQRRFIFFVDNLSLNPFNRNRVFKALKEFVDDSMEEGDEAMIAAWNRSMKIRVPFTSDREFIKAELDVLAGESGLGTHYTSEKKQVEERIREASSVQQAVLEARSWALSVEHDLRQSVRAINGLLEQLAGVEGKKAFVMTSEGFYIQPGREMFYFIDETRHQRSDWGQSSGGVMLEGMGFNASHLIRSVAHTANANDITLYTLHAGGLMGMETASAANREPVSMTVQHAALSNSTEALQLMAEMTGGLATIGTNNFSAAMKRIDQDLDSYYSLGYRSSTQRIDRQRTIEVRSKNKAHRVRSKRTFVEKSIGTEMTDKVIAKLFFQSEENDLGIVLRTEKPTLVEDDIFIVPLQIHIPIDNLTLIPQGTARNRGGFSVWLVAADQQNDMSDVTTQSHTVNLSDEQLEELRGRHYIYEVELRMRRGRNMISVGVIDDISKVKGFRTQSVLALNLN